MVKEEISFAINDTADKVNAKEVEMLPMRNEEVQKIVEASIGRSCCSRFGKYIALIVYFFLLLQS